VGTVLGRDVPVGLEERAEERHAVSLPSDEGEIGTDHGAASVAAMTGAALPDPGVEEDATSSLRIGRSGDRVEPGEPGRRVTELGTIGAE
jgi:hypothetical protein